LDFFRPDAVTHSICIGCGVLLPKLIPTWNRRLLFFSIFLEKEI
jgi:hypothetical protein